MIDDKLIREYITRKYGVLISKYEVACIMHCWRCLCTKNIVNTSGRSKRVAPPTAKIFLNFMQFIENLAKSYVGATGLAPPPTGNPGSAPE